MCNKSNKKKSNESNRISIFWNFQGSLQNSNIHFFMHDTPFYLNLEFPKPTELSTDRPTDRPTYRIYDRKRTTHNHRDLFIFLRNLQQNQVPLLLSLFFFLRLFFLQSFLSQLQFFLFFKRVRFFFFSMNWMNESVCET